MTHTYKMSVLWEDGTAMGILGEGWDESQALADAHRRLVEQTNFRKGKFTIVKPADFHALPESVKSKIQEDWDRHQYSSYHSYP
jgi:hypothetical protein